MVYFPPKVETASTRTTLGLQSFEAAFSPARNEATDVDRRHRRSFVNETGFVPTSRRSKDAGERHFVISTMMEALADAETRERADAAMRDDQVQGTYARRPLKTQKAGTFP
jgi:hypothetical protein